MTNLMKAIKKVSGTVETRVEVLEAVAKELGFQVTKEFAIAGSASVITNKDKTIKIEISCTKKDGLQVIKKVFVAKLEMVDGKRTLQSPFFYNLKRGEYVVSGAEEYEVVETVAVEETVEVEAEVEEVTVETVEVETVAVETANVVITDRKTGIRIDYYTITTDKLEAELEDLKRQSNYYKDCNVTINGKLELRF